MASRSQGILAHGLALLLAAVTSWAQGPLGAGKGHAFPLGAPRAFDELPASRLRSRIESLPPAAQGRAMAWLRSFHFTDQDVGSLHADAEGGICYACRLLPERTEGEPGAVASEPPVAGAAMVPVSPFPSNLVFHSRPGSPNILYLNFCGETVVNTEWNKVVGRAEIPALAFSTDSDYGTFSDAEQTAIKRIWQRVAEDYAPFDIDVTTERPAVMGTRTAHAVITRNTDANGAANPYSTAGGVAYVNVFALKTYAQYRPAWVYHNNLSNNESYIGEAASHEVGHNLGLSHDGRTDGYEYYSGHGVGDISWGPIMGASYLRNVTQWSRGEYYLANNTQDDLATVAGKIAYRADDHGNTAASATPLVISGGSNIVSTTPETDPQNAVAANKGLLERNTDEDVFSFVTGGGVIRLAVQPWVMPAGTRGGDVDIVMELRNDGGVVVAATNPAALTSALLEPALPEGRYSLHIRNAGAGDPFAATPTGYTSYGGIGQYFISGYVIPATGFVVPPVAELRATDLTQVDHAAWEFTVTYSDNVAIDVTTLDSGDIRVSGPNGYDRAATLVSVDAAGNGSPRTATYAITPPAGDVWRPEDNGTYTVWIQAGQVGDTEGAWVAAGALGLVKVAVPVALYSATMDSDPGWTLDPQWQYGVPAYADTGPTGGFTGIRIVGYNLSGNYEKSLGAKYATTPPIDTTGSSTLTLRFRRWLRVRANDPAGIQVSTNGTTWLTVWSTTMAAADTAWQLVQYTLPAGVAGHSAVRVRWSLASNAAQQDIGWNLDDVELLGDGALDARAPVPRLSMSDLTMGGSPSHACSVTYTDDTAVRLLSLDSTDLLVTGPNGYSNVAEFVGADLPDDGSPVTASYAIPAPTGAWSVADNGAYTVTLLDGAVADTLNNATPETPLGGFTVAIPAGNPGVELTVSVNHPEWGSVSSTGGLYAAGTFLELLALPAAYYRFGEWALDASGTNNPLVLVLESNLAVQAVFYERLTTNFPTPYGWLAGFGYTNDPESAVTEIGANGMAVWQSCVAGLNPTNPDSRFTLAGGLGEGGGSYVLAWQTATDRVYTLHSSTNLAESFMPVPGATNMPWSVQSFTNLLDQEGPGARFYRLDVTKP